MPFPSPQNRRTFLTAASLLALGGLAGCNTTSVLSPPGDGSDETEATLGLINSLRKARGLSPLSRDPAAASAALSQAGRMAKAGKMAHLIGITDSFGARMKSQSVSLPAAENIAVGQADAQKAYLAWLNSPKHLENMLGPGYSGLGVAVMRNPASGNRPYWAMVLSSGT
ncbi:secretion protein [Rhizobium sp. Leaf371]|uniref:CAP domain-containing protein n=1 Tax=Rhizobium sp. Leaf371 TaxID=1736355 RepID=UPI000715C163|nr:CAP domain-containing protein [Rhizobium sp. Leaf371]KQS65210.1 secretion protein [Rhizobium sp. Leaf371]